MSTATNLIARAREAGLAPELANVLERDLNPKLESFLASVPDLPPANASNEETRLLLGLVHVYWAHVPLLVGALDRLIDGVSAGLNDLFDQATGSDDAKRKSLHHMEEALASLVRVGSGAAALVARHPQLDGIAQLQAFVVTEIVDDLRPYLRGVLSTIVGLDRLEDTPERLAPWAWMARRETLKSEGLFMIELRKLVPEPPARPRRVSGDWKGRVQVPDDFDAPLPKDVEDSFYDSNL